MINREKRKPGNMYKAKNVLSNLRVGLLLENQNPCIKKIKGVDSSSSAVFEFNRL